MRKSIRSRIGGWIDTLPPDHLYWRIYKIMPLVAGILFSITEILELAYFHSIFLIIVTAIWYVGVFWLIANLMVYPK